MKFVIVYNLKKKEKDKGYGICFLVASNLQLNFIIAKQFATKLKLKIYPLRFVFRFHFEKYIRKVCGSHLHIQKHGPYRMSQLKGLTQHIKKKKFMYLLLATLFP
jgi:hypothetical protein